MKRYKLIKEYPGSPKLGSIKSVHDIFIEKTYPEFWSEIEQEDYKILTMKNSNGNLYTLFENEKLGHQEKEINSIFSVKRIEDNQIFTVGNLVKNTNYSDHIGNIERFVLDTRINAIRVYYASGYDYLKDISTFSEKEIEMEYTHLSLNDVFSIYPKFNNKGELTHHAELLINLAKNKDKL